MKIYLISVLCILVFTSCSQNNSGNSGYISKNVSFYDPNTILDYIKKNRISPEQAISSVDSLQKAFKSSYIGYSLKKTLIGKSGDEVFNECKDTLNQNSAGLSSYELYDYVLQCLAGFKDSHIYLSKMITPSFVSSGISESMMVNNKLYITRIRPGLIKKIEELQKLPEGSLAEKLKIGTEILAINGNDPKVEIDKLKKYISASSELALQNESISRLFLRHFAYPDKPNFSLTLKTADASAFEVTLPWVQVINNSNQGSLESRTLLSDRGIIKSSELNPDVAFIRSKGVDLSTPLFENLANSRIYQDETEEDVLVTGVISIQNKNYCYMQLNTFNFERDEEFGFKIFEKISGKNHPLGLLEVLKNYLQTCETTQSPLIFDLRNNGGGNARLADIIYTLFENKNTKVTYNAKAHLTKIGNFSVSSKSLDSIDSDMATLENLLTFQSMKEALDTNSPATNWVLTRNMKLTRNLFTGNIIILASPNCVSACESTTNRFKKSGRAKVIGESTNGTGFGFISNGKGVTNFRDPLNLFEVEMPNQAFQSALVENENDVKVMDEVKGSLLPFGKMELLENNPVTPDIEIKYTLNDLIGGYPDYIESLSKVLTRAGGF